MSGGVPNGAIRAPLEIENHVDRIGEGIWLYLHLLGLAQHDGRVMCRLDQLAAAFKTTEDQAQAWLGVLHATCLIEPTTPPPFLVIRLPFWSGEGEKPASTYSSNSLLSSNESKSSSDSYRQDESKDLLENILFTLGESDPEEFRPVLNLYSATVIRRALDRVRVARDIRKSKTALFRHLLGKLSKHQ